MEEFFIVLVVLALIGVPIAVFLWLLSRISRTADEIRRLEMRFNLLQAELRKYQPTTPPSPIFPASPKAPVAPEPPPVMTVAVSVPTVAVKPVVVPPSPLVETEPKLPSFNWEQFMGVKLFAWLGGLALFLGVAFFVKYSFDNNLVTREMRVTLGYLTGVGLVVGGLVLARRNFLVLGQTLCATSMLVFYANTFAAHAYYHFLGSVPAFGVMALVTAAAFVLAVRMEAQVVGVLGLLGGFLTPVLLSTGQDNPLGLFGYLAVLNIGLLAVVSRTRWTYQTALAAICTIVMQFAWVAKFFAVSKVYTAMTVFLGFEALFVIAWLMTEESDGWQDVAALGLTAATLAFAFILLTYRQISIQPWLLFSFVLGADIGLLAMPAGRGRLAWAQLAGGGLVFLLLAVWTAVYVSADLLNWALGFYILFAVVHSVFPVVLERRRPGTVPVWWGNLFSPVALLLVMIPVLKLPELSWLVWVCVLAIDVVVFALAVATASLLAVAGALVLTLVAAACWIFKVPVAGAGVTELLVVIGGFAVVFFAVSVWLSKRPGFLTTERTGEGLPEFVKLPSDTVRAQLPAASAVLPFVLLILVVARMPLANPTPVFGLGLLLAVLLLGVARMTKVDALGLVGLLCCAALEYAWHSMRFNAVNPVVPLVWYVVFTMLFTVFPFLFRREMADRTLPWAVSALAGPVHFMIVYRLVQAAWPNPVMGLLPVAFAVPPLIGLVLMARGESGKRLGQLAWLGGAALFFVTLIFPIQFEQQWITVGWALEGVALLWLFRRVPHNGLRWVGAGLLCVVFARLALNPSVLDYHPRSATAIWNWYLYAYGIVVACLFVGARLVAGWRKAAPVLATLGTVLAFLLLNIEIADYFTAPGTRALTFEFSGSFGRDMTYSIAWALFALALLVAGIARKLTAARYASLALLGVTLLKLFFHDLARLGQLYRIGAFIGVAIILLISSFLYQRFVPSERSEK